MVRYRTTGPLLPLCFYRRQFCPRHTEHRLDLALVAVLTVFSGTHELTHPSAIPIFLSWVEPPGSTVTDSYRYFAILSWIWTSQCFYDIRYEANDVFHRMTKSSQIVTFIFIGAASGNWNLNTMQSPSQVPGISIEDGASNRRSLVTQCKVTDVPVSILSRKLHHHHHCICHLSRASSPPVCCL